MRRSVQPHCPTAMTCCFFPSLTILARSAESLTASPPRQRLERLLPMAGFQVSIYGRFWVSTEGVEVESVVQAVGRVQQPSVVPPDQVAKLLALFILVLGRSYAT